MKVKRAFDVLAAALGLIVASPVLAAIAVVVRATSPGPALHRARRVGRGGSIFTVYKFRTMRVGEEGIGVTATGDPRITSIGRVLRKLKVDEVPQLINVVRGEMSLVGPRPEDPRYVAGYSDTQRRVLDVRPGITSPASITYRHEERLLGGREGEERAAHYREHILPAKIALDLEYIEQRSFWGDIAILLRTGAAVFRGPTPGPTGE